MKQAQVICAFRCKDHDTSTFFKMLTGNCSCQSHVYNNKRRKPWDTQIRYIVFYFNNKDLLKSTMAHSALYMEVFIGKNASNH